MPPSAIIFLIISGPRPVAGFKLKEYALRYPVRDYPRQELAGRLSGALIGK